MLVLKTNKNKLKQLKLNLVNLTDQVYQQFFLELDSFPVVFLGILKETIL
jgi:hypothetical protein